MKMMMLFLCCLFIANSNAWISQEVDDHKKTSCATVDSEYFLALIEGIEVKAAIDLGLRGERRFFGELLSLTINTETDVVSYTVSLENNPSNYRWMTIQKKRGGASNVAFHFDMSTIAEVVQKDVDCFLDWL